MGVFAALIKDFWLMLIMHWPGGTGAQLRYRYYRRRLAHLGVGVTIDAGVYISNPGYVSIDDNCWIDRGVTILAGPCGGKDREFLTRTNADFRLQEGVVSIGKNCHIGIRSIISGFAGVQLEDNVNLGPDTKLYSLTHHYRSVRHPSRPVVCGSRGARDRQCLFAGPVVLKAGAVVMANAIIMPAVTIGKNSAVLIGSVVLRGVPENVVVRGDPMNVVGVRFPNSPNTERSLSAVNQTREG